MAAQTEADIAELDTWEERQEFLAEIGLEESGVSRLIRSAYALLDLQTYFTAGPDEVRAWTFMRGPRLQSVPVSSIPTSRRDLSVPR